MIEWPNWSTEEWERRIAALHTGTALAEWDENDHPRDDSGKFVSIGVSGIAPDRYLDQSLSSLKASGNWKMRLVKERNDWENTRDYAIDPMNIPASVAPAPGSRGGWYDTDLADVDGDTVKPKLVDGWHEDIPATAASGALFRGMSYAEYREIERAGSVRSDGDYNLGDGEKGLTYFSTDPEQAAHYASGFAPWQFKASFGRSAYVVEVKDPGDAKISHDTERGLLGGIDAKKIVSVYEGRPYRISKGEMDFYQKHKDSPHSEGSRMSPSSWLVWKKIR